LWIFLFLSLNAFENGCLVSEKKKKRALCEAAWKKTIPRNVKRRWQGQNQNQPTKV